MYYQLTLTEEPSYTDYFQTADWREFDRRKNALEAVATEAREYGASIEAYHLFEQFQKAMRVNQLPEPAPRQPRVTVREVTHDPLVARPSRFQLCLLKAYSIVSCLF